MPSHPSFAFPADFHDLPVRAGLEVGVCTRPWPPWDIGSLPTTAPEEGPGDDGAYSELVGL